MVTQSELKECFSEWARTYQFLSHVFFKELTTEAVQQLASAEYLEDSGNENLDQGYKMIRRYFKFRSNDARTQLACEYARIFLASGVYTETRDVAVPYESVFTSDEQIVMQDSRDDVYRRYLQDGFKVDPDLHEPEDHLSFELEYLSHMNFRAEKLLAAESWEELEINLMHQREFIEAHLLNWLPALRKTAQKYAKLTFYIGMLLVAEGYAQESEKLIDTALETVEKLKNDGSARLEHREKMVAP